MALFRAIESAEPPGRRMFDDPLATRFLTGLLGALAAWARVPLAGRAATWLLDAGWPRIRSSAVVRTIAIDEVVRAALRSGIRQCVLLGAGFDSRAHRIAAGAPVTAFEVDHPATQAVKRRRLAAVAPATGRDVRYVAIDFEADDVSAALLAAGFQPAERSVVVWEGVVSYLSAAAVDATIATLGGLMDGGSVLVFTYVHRGALDGSASFREAKRWASAVRSSGEPFTFGFEPAALPEYMHARGFSLVRDDSTADAAREYNARFGRDERGSALYRVAVARRDGGDARAEGQ